MKVKNIGLIQKFWNLRYMMYLQSKRHKPLGTRFNIFVSFDGLSCGRATLFICKFSLSLFILPFHNPQKFIPVKSINMSCYMDEAIQNLTKCYIQTKTLSEN